MNFNFLKFKIPRFKFNWNDFLWFLILFLFIVLLFDAWIFWRFFLKKPEASFGAKEGTVLQTQLLDKVLKRLEEKQLNFENYKENVSVEDPS